MELKKVLIDTNVVMKCPTVLDSFEGRVVLYIGCIQELERLKQFSNDEEAKANARRARRKIRKYMDEITFIFDENRYEKLPTDDALIEIAKDYGYSIISNDLGVQIKAAANNIDCQEYLVGDNFYTGIDYIDIELDDNGYNKDLEEILKMSGEDSNLRSNQFLIVNKNDDKKSYCILQNKNNEIVSFTTKPFTNSYNRKIYPRNPEQQCLFSLLNDPDITIISITGCKGSGKSFICANYALQELEKGNINKIVYVPNNSFNRDTREIAAVPGELLDKEFMHMGTLVDIVGADFVRQLCENGQIEVVPISVMRGRSFDDAIIFVNEAQNLTEDHVELLISRCGTNTKILFDGDLKQADSYKFENKSGLRKLSKLSLSDEFSSIFGAVKLIETERSFTAKAATYLEELE